MAVKTAYYIQRLSDGKILGGIGYSTTDSYDYNPFDWRTLTGTQLSSQAHWVLTNLDKPFSDAESTLSPIINSLPQSNGDWDQDLFRLLPIQQNQ